MNNDSDMNRAPVLPFPTLRGNETHISRDLVTRAKGVPIRIHFTYRTSFGNAASRELPDFVVSADQIYRLPDVRKVISRDHVVQVLQRSGYTFGDHMVEQILVYVHEDGAWKSYDLTDDWNAKRNIGLWHQFYKSDAQITADDPKLKPTIRLILKRPAELS